MLRSNPTLGLPSPNTKICNPFPKRLPIASRTLSNALDHGPPGPFSASAMSRP